MVYLHCALFVYFSVPVINVLAIVRILQTWLDGAVIHSYTKTLSPISHFASSIQFSEEITVARIILVQMLLSLSCQLFALKHTLGTHTRLHHLFCIEVNVNANKPPCILCHSFVSHVAPPVAKVVPEWHGWHSLTVIRRYPFKKGTLQMQREISCTMYVPENMTVEEEEDWSGGGGKEMEREAEQSVWKGFSRKLS